MCKLLDFHPLLQPFKGDSLKVFIPFPCGVVAFSCAAFIARAFVARFEDDGVTKISGFAVLASCPARVIQAFQTFPSDCVTRVRISDIYVARASAGLAIVP